MDKLFVTDLQGKAIEITDYEAALSELEGFCSMNNPYNMDINGKSVSLNTYWADLLKKVKALNREQSHKTIQT